MKGTVVSGLGKLVMGVSAVLLMATAAQAVPTGYKSRAAFDAAVAGIAGVTEDVLNFDSTPTGTVIPSGSALGGVTFTDNLPSPFQIGVNTSTGTSGTNFLGVTGDGGSSFGRFALGDVIDFSFGASHAFGMYIIVSPGFDLFDNDVNLTFAGITLSNVDADVATTVNGVDALFVGIVDPASTFTTANLTFGTGTGPALFEIDDIVKTSPVSSSSPVPGPATLALVGGGMLGVALIRRRAA